MKNITNYIEEAKMSKTVYEPDHQSLLECKSCGYKTSDSVEFNEHVHTCAIRPVPMPAAEVERREATDAT
jgi:hypothetical protein